MKEQRKTGKNREDRDRGKRRQKREDGIARLSKTRKNVWVGKIARNK